MRDRDIRLALHSHLSTLHQDSETLILDELGLCQGSARIDVAVVNGSLSGFEIKSPLDTLERLDGQAVVYARTLDSVTLVTSSSHIHAIAERVPDWWGVMLAAQDDRQVTLSTVREAQENADVDPHAIAQLLWREEALAILKELTLDKGMANKSRRVIWDKLVEVQQPEELRRRVRDQLRSRQGWRSATPQRSDGVTCPPGATL